MKKTQQQWNKIEMTPEEVRKALLVELEGGAIYFAEETEVKIEFTPEGGAVILGYIGDL